jgi:hypothetical protein
MLAEACPGPKWYEHNHVAEVSIDVIQRGESDDATSSAMSTGEDDSSDEDEDSKQVRQTKTSGNCYG